MTPNMKILPLTSGLKERPATEKVKRNFFGIEVVTTIKTRNDSAFKEVTCAYTVPLYSFLSKKTTHSESTWKRPYIVTK